MFGARRAWSLRLGPSRATIQRSPWQQPTARSWSMPRREQFDTARVPTQLYQGRLQVRLRPLSTFSNTPPVRKPFTDPDPSTGAAGPTWCNLDNVLSLAGFAMTDVLLLRVLTMVATSCGLVYSITHNPPLRQWTYWGAVFLAVNGYMAMCLVLERENEVSFSKEEWEVFEEHFMPYGVRPTEFKKVVECAQWMEVPAGVVLAEEGVPMSCLLLITNGDVQAYVASSQVPVHSLSTFPGARKRDANNIDTAAWVGEVNFLDDPRRSKEGCIATFVTTSPTTYLQWDNVELRQLLAENPALSRTATKLVTTALVVKIMRFASQTRTHSVEAYSDILAAVLVDGTVGNTEKRVLREYRERFHVSDDVHRAALARLGWTAEEFEDGSKWRVVEGGQRGGVGMERGGEGLPKVRAGIVRSLTRRIERNEAARDAYGDDDVDDVVTGVQGERQREP